MHSSIISNGKPAVYLSVFFATVSVLCGLVINFSGVMSVPVKYPIYALSLAAGYFSIVYASLHCRNNTVKKYVLIWILFIIYLLCVGAIQSSLFTEGTNINTFLSQDLRFVMYVGIGIFLADSGKMNSFHKIIRFVAYMSMAFGIVALMNYNFSYAQASEGTRIGIWNLPYYLWWASGGVFAYMYAYSRITGKDRIAGIGSFCFYVLLGMLFIKRSVAVNAVMLISISEILVSAKKGKTSKNKSHPILRILIVLAVLIVIAMIIPYTRILISSLVNRFTSNGSFFEYDRTMEAIDYFSSVSLSDILFGQGMGHYVTTTREINSLHTGLFNLVYKGGGVLLAVYIYFCVRVVKIFIHRKNLPKMGLVWLAVALSYMVSMLYEASWSYTIYLFQYVTPIVALLVYDSENTARKKRLYSRSSGNKIFKTAQERQDEVYQQ